MKHIIIGTAGHIDHGKTTLIKAITGRDTDTLKEEKDRGISINLGFTYFDLPSSKRAGIVDVPGHEKFIKNMLAGATGIDIVLMVIAADEGIMPQTMEHFEILELLGVKKGIIVLTKADLVDDEWLDMVKSEVIDKFKGSFLEGAPVIPFSAKNLLGKNELIEAIDKLSEEIEEKDLQGHFRLPVDRVFSVSGFGTVVTGTIVSGSVEEGELIEVYPQGTLAKVRGLQVHDVSVKEAYAGQRCAVNLANIKVAEVTRGDIIAKPKVMEASSLISVRLKYLSKCQKNMVNRQRVRFYYGTSEVMCRVVLLNCEELKPGEEALAQLFLEKPITCQRGDRFVIRSYSPMDTIGGGLVIDPAAVKHKRFDDNYINELKNSEKDDPIKLLEAKVLKLSPSFPNCKDILKALGKNENSISDNLLKLAEENKIIIISCTGEDIYLHKNFYDEKIMEIKKLLEAFHKENPLRLGISKEEIKTKMFSKGINVKAYDKIIENLILSKEIEVKNGYVSLYNFKITLNHNQMEIKNLIIKSLEDSLFKIPKPQDMEGNFKDKKEFYDVLEALIEMKELVKINEDCIMTVNQYFKAKEILKEYINSNKAIATPDFKNLLDTNRKVAVALLEHFDSVKFTKRIGDNRILF